MPARSGMITGGAVLALFLVALLAMPAGMEGLYNTVYQVEGQIARMLIRVSGKDGERKSGGKLERGNNYRTGAAHLQLSADRSPSEALYLYDFQGGEYIGSGWYAANDEEVLLDIIAESKWPFGTLFWVYHSMYYEMNEISWLGEGIQPQTISLDIVHCDKQYDDQHLYSPYCSTFPKHYTYNVTRTKSVTRGYGYSYCEQKDRKVDWDTIKDYYNDYSNGGRVTEYQLLQQVYMEKIQDAYTRVPTELLPRLTQLCKENPQSTLEDITTFIIYTLHSNTSYTLTPGWIPLNEDAVEYFLFEGGRGYCEHYAATAALMYRLYGIPARYVSGYKIPASEFQLDIPTIEELAKQLGTTVGTLLEAYAAHPDSCIDNGRKTIRLSDYIKWNAVATDEMAHAWVEIFLEDYGWIPIEVTPASDGSIVAGYPGFSEESLWESLEKHGWDIKKPSLAAAVSQDNMGQDGEQTSGKEDSGGQKKKALVARGFLVYFFCLLPMALEYNRLRRLGKLDKASSQKTFGQLMQMLQYGGYLAGYDGTEEEFAVRLAGKFEEVPQEEIRRLQDIVSEAAYGLERPGSGQAEYVRRVYRCLAQAAYRRCKWYQKLVFRYWKGYL